MQQPLWQLALFEAKTYADQNGVNMLVFDNIETMEWCIYLSKDNTAVRLKTMVYASLSRAEIEEIYKKIKTAVDLLSGAHTQVLHRA